MVQLVGRRNNRTELVRKEETEMTFEELKAMKDGIPAGEILSIAKELMTPEDIDHHASDLYLRLTDVSAELAKKYEHNWMVTKFYSNIPPTVLWFEFPFCWQER